MIIQSKIDETKDHMRKVARKLDEEKREKAKAERTGTGSSYPVPSYHDTMGISIDDYEARPSLKASTRETSTGGKKKGLQLGKGRKKKDILDSLIAEGETVEREVDVTKAAVSKPARPASEQVKQDSQYCQYWMTILFMGRVYFA